MLHTLLRVHFCPKRRQALFSYLLSNFDDGKDDR